MHDRLNMKTVLRPHIVHNFILYPGCNIVSVTLALVYTNVTINVIGNNVALFTGICNSYPHKVEHKGVSAISINNLGSVLGLEQRGCISGISITPC